MYTLQCTYEKCATDKLIFSLHECLLVGLCNMAGVFIFLTTSHNYTCMGLNISWWMKLKYDSNFQRLTFQAFLRITQCMQNNFDNDFVNLKTIYCRLAIYCCYISLKCNYNSNFSKLKCV